MGDSYAQESLPEKKRPVHFTRKKCRLGEILDSLEAQTKVCFFGALDYDRKLPIRANGKPLEQVLKSMLSRKHYAWRFKEDYCIISQLDPSDTVSARKSRPPSTLLEGRVYGEPGELLIGANVSVKGGNKRTQTDSTGNFTLTGLDTSAVLEISYVGYDSQLVKVSGQLMIDVQLRLSDRHLDEVVIAGLTESSKRATPASITHQNFGPTQTQGNNNPITGLHGMVPNLVIKQTSGVPGGAISVQIRGRNSIQKPAQPLYVINGIPYAANFQTINLRPSLASQNIYGGISPFNIQMFGQIKSITILKDADATAIYGSRGANGVIIIETVRGKPGKTTFDINISQGAGKLASNFELLNTTDYLALRRRAYQNDGLTPGNTPGDPAFAPDITLWPASRNTNWQKALLGKTAHITDVNGALAFGNEGVRVRVGGGYFRETSLLPGDQKYESANVNVMADFISRNKRFGFQSSIGYCSDNSRSYNGSLKGVLTPPNAAAAWTNGQLKWEEGVDHAYAEFLRIYTIAKINYLVSNIIKWSPNPSISTKTTFGFSGLTTNEADRVPIASLSPFAERERTGSYNRVKRSIIGYIVEPIAEFTPRFLNGALTVVAGASFQHTTSNNTLATGEGFSNDLQLVTMENSRFYSRQMQYQTKYIYGAFFSQLKYDHLKKYLASVSFRRDVSSRFSPDRNSGNFLSVGAAWVFSEEPLFKKPWLYFGKLRGSFGLTGSDLVDDYQYQAVWLGNANNNPYQGVNGISPQAPFNPEFSWEKVQKGELGLDVELLKGRIQTGFSYYHNKSYNQIIRSRLPAQAGFQGMLRNGSATILNTGFEIVVSSNIVQTNNVYLNIAANVAFPRNKLTAYNNLKQSFDNGVLRIGEPVTVINKLQSDGVSKETGLYMLKDMDGVAGYTDKDYVSKGSFDPTFLAGMDINFRWKNFELRVVIDIRKEYGPSYNYPMLLADRYVGALSNHITAANNYWTQPGDDAAYQKPSALPGSEVNKTKSLVIASSESVANTSYGKLRDCSLTFHLPDKIASSIGCTYAGIYFKGRNLYTITSYNAGDPEIANILSLSTIKTVHFGLRLSF